MILVDMLHTQKLMIKMIILLGGVVSGLGGGADLAYTASPINSNSYKNDTESYKVGLTYAVLKNANIGVSYTEK